MRFCQVESFGGLALLGCFLAGCGGGGSMFSFSVLLAPANLQAVAGDAKVSLNWATSPGATSYIIERGTGSNAALGTIASNVAATSYTDTSVINGTTYFYAVLAVNSIGTSLSSNQASATPEAPPA